MDGEYGSGHSRSPVCREVGAYDSERGHACFMYDGGHAETLRNQIWYTHTPSATQCSREGLFECTRRDAPAAILKANCAVCWCRQFRNEFGCAEGTGICLGALAVR